MCGNKRIIGIATVKRTKAEKNKILKFYQYMELDKIPYIIYAYLEYRIKKIDRKIFSIKQVNIFLADI